VTLALLASPILGGRMPSYKIIGGDDVSDISEFPFQGSLRYFGTHSCGCALISSTWAVTAAHCVGGPNSFYEVAFGSRNRFDDVQTRTPAQIISHHSWEIGSGAFPNDIALIRFNAVNLVSGQVEAIGLGSSSNNFEGQNGWISGWGRTQTGGVGGLPTILQKAQIEIYTRSYCEGQWGSNINDGHICIGVRNQIGSCNGDSGGPLVNSAKNTLVGVTSWGITNCYTFVPSVYSRISYFREWIRDNSGV